MFTHTHTHKNIPACSLQSLLHNDQWINKAWYIHTMEQYSAIKKNELLIQITIWVNLKNIMLEIRGSVLR